MDERKPAKINNVTWSFDCKDCMYSEGTEASLYLFCTKRGQKFPLGYVCSGFKKETSNDEQGSSRSDKS